MNPWGRRTIVKLCGRVRLKFNKHSCAVGVHKPEDKGSNCTFPKKWSGSGGLRELISQSHDLSEMITFKKTYNTEITYENVKRRLGDKMKVIDKMKKPARKSWETAVNDIIDELLGDITRVKDSLKSTREPESLTQLNKSKRKLEVEIDDSSRQAKKHKTNSNTDDSVNQQQLFELMEKNSMALEQQQNLFAKTQQMYQTQQKQIRDLKDIVANHNKEVSSIVS